MISYMSYTCPGKRSNEKASVNLVLYVFIPQEKSFDIGNGTLIPISILRSVHNEADGDPRKLFSGLLDKVFGRDVLRLQLSQYFTSKLFTYGLVSKMVHMVAHLFYLRTLIIFILHST